MKWFESNECIWIDWYLNWLNVFESTFRTYWIHLNLLNLFEVKWLLALTKKEICRSALASLALKKKPLWYFILGRFRSKTCWDILYYSLNARMIRQKSQSLHERTYLRFRISKFLEDVLNSSFCFDDFDNFGTWNSQLKEE